MDCINNNGDGCSEEASAEEERFFIEDYSSSEGEGVIELGDQKQRSSRRHTAPLGRESSPPLLLAFSVGCGRGLQDSSPSPASSPALQQEEEDGDHPIEEWMILGGEEQVGDSSIQLNLGYWKSPEDDSGDEDSRVTSITDIWAVSEKDKCGANLCPSSRYFVPDRSLICQMCNRMGHLAKRCYYHKKYSTCILCGIQGHIQRDCPGRHCPSCGLPSHGLKPCEKPPVWNQHCQRCGITGHLSDACPDTWRQYHLTIQSEVPLRPSTVHTHKHKRYQAHCYNCSIRGHYGFYTSADHILPVPKGINKECTKKRMVSGTFPSLPYVCYYDTVEDILQYRAKIQERAKGLRNAGPLLPSDQHHLSEPNGESFEESSPVQGRSRTKQEASIRTGRRKTWPERRRERREVKRLRREAQARRGGLSGKSRCNSDDEACPGDLLKYLLHRHRTSTPPPQKKRKDEADGRRSRKSKEAERWKKRGGIKRGDLYPHGDLDIESENLLSPKQRVRHRRR